MTDADVIVVGAGPTGLMLAVELRLAGVRPLVLERRPRLRETPRANGLGGQILRLLHYRGLLARFEAAASGPTHAAPRYPFGDVHLDFSDLADPPLRGLTLPQPRLEGLGGRRRRARRHRRHRVADSARQLGRPTRRRPHRVTGRLPATPRERGPVQDI